MQPTEKNKKCRTYPEITISIATVHLILKLLRKSESLKVTVICKIKSVNYGPNEIENTLQNCHHNTTKKKFG